MNEREPGRPEEPRLTITHDEAILNPELRPDYQKQRQEAVRAGHKVWEVRDIMTINLDVEPLITYDYYFKEIGRGYILGNEEVGFDVRGAIFEPTLYGYEQHGLANLSLEGPVESFYEAQKILEDYVHGTVPPDAA